MSSTAEKNDIRVMQKEIVRWLIQQQNRVSVFVKAVSTASRVSIITAEDFDIIKMGATKNTRCVKGFFGTLAGAVSKELHKPLVIVYNTKSSSVPNNARVKRKDQINE